MLPARLGTTLTLASVSSLEDEGRRAGEVRVPRMLSSAHEIPHVLSEQAHPGWAMLPPVAPGRTVAPARGVLGRSVLRCSVEATPQIRTEGVFFFSTQHLLMFSQHTRKCWTEQYVLMGLEFIYAAK